jgi:Ca2+:H+ antiporter
MMLKWTLAFVPLAIALEYLTPQSHLLIFVAAAIAILPLAAWLGRATEQLADRSGEGVGGLLNATFGNAAELIIALAALRAGLHDVVKATIVGSIVGNILLVLGAAMLAGGVRHQEQYFNESAGRAQATMLTLAAIALVIPAAYSALVGELYPGGGMALSISISLVLLSVYGAFLLFSLWTHAESFRGVDAPENVVHSDPWPLGQSIAVLAGATVAIAWLSEILVGAIEPTAHELGLSNMFVGVFIVAILGNAAEHATAITAAMKNRMDLSLSIAIGSSVQVALFVAPLLVLASLVVGPQPMDLLFGKGLVLAVLLAVLITGQVAGDGRFKLAEGRAAPGGLPDFGSGLLPHSTGLAIVLCLSWATARRTIALRSTSKMTAVDHPNSSTPFIAVIGPSNRHRATGRTSP